MMTTQSFVAHSMTSRSLTANAEKEWPVVLVEVAAATVACLLMMGLMAVTAYGLAGLLG
jgi:hypothetical protein